MTLLARPRALKAQIARTYRERRVTPILSDPTPPDTAAAERDFDALQAAYPRVPEYGYDDVSLGARAASRIAFAFDHLPRTEGALRTLDVGAGEGTLGAMLAGAGHDVALCDLEDWRKPSANALPFFAADCCAGLPFDADRFDLVTSFNCFEHMADPKAALDEIVRVTRPGGIIYLDFGPLYAGPWGLHAYRTLFMPYPQFLFSPDFVADKLASLGISDLGGDRATLQFVNGWRPAQYRAIWSHPGLEIVFQSLDTIHHFWRTIAQYPESFRGRGLAYEDMAAAQIRIVMRKRGGGGQHDG